MQIKPQTIEDFYPHQFDGLDLLLLNTSQD